MTYRVTALILALGVTTNVSAAIIGDRALGMGGAFVALTDDPSAIWYNPAGLAWISGDLLTLSGNAYTFQKLRHQSFATFRAQSGQQSQADFTTSSVMAFPSTLTYGTAFESGDP